MPRFAPPLLLATAYDSESDSLARYDGVGARVQGLARAASFVGTRVLLGPC